MDSKRIEQIKKQFDDVIQTTEQGNVEYWYARDLMKLLGYTEWRNFEKAIGRAKNIRQFYLLLSRYCDKVFCK